MPRTEPLPLPEALDLLRSTLDQSPADYTEIAWSEAIRQSGATPGGAVDGAPVPLPHCTLQVRVVERGRSGHYTTGNLEMEELRHAVRQALAQAATAPPVSSGGHPLEPPDDTSALPSPLSTDALFDPAIAHLTPAAAADLLGERLESGRETGALDWIVGRVVVVNSKGLERQTAVTCARLQLQRGEGPGAGQAASAARTLQQLDAPGTLERARLRAAAGSETADPGEPFATVYLAPEATAGLILHLRRLLRTHLTFPVVEAALLPRLGSASLDPYLHLADDPLAEAGLPFPFDLRGAPLGARVLLTEGAVQPPFPPATNGPGDERGSHLILQSGATAEARLWELCEGGLFVPSIHKVDCREPGTLGLRCSIHGARRIRGGQPAEILCRPTLDLALLPALETVLGIGTQAVTLAEGDGLYGGVRAPALALTLCH